MMRWFSPSEHPAAHRGRWALIGLAVVYTIAIGITAALRAESTSDFRDFWENAVRFRQTGEIAADLGVHNYLPFFTIFMLPWGLLPLRVAMVFFVVLSLALFAITVVLAENLLSDGARTGRRTTLLTALALMMPYVHSCAVLGNVGLLVLFLVMSAWFLVEHQREWEAGAALGLAALVKLIPGLLIVFFLFKRRWRVAGVGAAVMIVFGLGLPVLTVGWKQTVSLHHDFYVRAFQEGSAAQTITSDKPIKALYSNNALPIVLRRLLSHVDGARGDDKAVYVDFADLPRGTILAIYMALLAAFLGTSAGLTFPRTHPWPPDSVEAGRTVRAQFGLWCCLMLLAAPLVWTHYLPLAYWPLAVLADRLQRSWRSGRVCRVSAAALGLWLLGALCLAWPAARAAGAQLAAVVGLWLALAYVSATRTP